jgi:hypothetical protein
VVVQTWDLQLLSPAFRVPTSAISVDPHAIGEEGNLTMNLAWLAALE